MKVKSTKCSDDHINSRDMILYTVLIFSFGFWNIFKNNKSLSPIFGFSFVATLFYTAMTIINNERSLDEKIVEGLIILFGLSILGFIMIALGNNKIAQIGAVVMASMGMNLYISNPHTPLDPSIKLAQNAELLVKLDHDHYKSIKKEIRQLDFAVALSPILSPQNTDQTELDDYIKLDIKNGFDINVAISTLNEIKGIQWIEPNEILTLKTFPSEKFKAKTSKFTDVVNDELAPRQWNMEALKMQDYFALFRNHKFAPKQQTKLFILDSGVDAQHEDITSNFAPHSSNDRSANESDDNGHGTHCAGVAAATTNNGIGIASMSPGKQWVSVGSVRVMNKFGVGSQARIVEGIIEAVDAGADVISMSLGGRSNQIKEEAYEDALNYAKLKNVIIVVAAGNNGGDAAKITPANSNQVITVTALNKDLEKAQFSNYISNTNQGLAAPGVSIISPWKNKRYSALDGTSMATPHVSGLIAVMRSLDPSLDTKKAYEILNKTGQNTKQTNLTGRMIVPSEAVKAVVK